MANYRVELSKPAEHDLHDIVRYISAQLAAPISAMRMMGTIETALTNLADMPHKCPLLAEKRLASLGYRKLVIENYIAFFVIDERTKTIDIERILYARRDWLHIL